jgi:hypothetical protein
MDDAQLIALDYERMMAEARIALAGSPDKLAVASVVAKRLASNPGALIDWDGFLGLNRPKHD